MKYDVFISHSSLNAKFAENIVNELESNGINCFIAPRNMVVGGSDFATQLVENITECPIFLFLFTKESNKSGMVIREINEAVNSNKYIITLKADRAEPNKSLHFYLSVNHWLEISCPMSACDKETIIKTIKKELESERKEDKEISYKGYNILNSRQLLDIGYSYKKINIACLNIDFEYLKKEDLLELVDEEIAEQEWLDNFEMYPDLADFLVYDDEIIGYYTFAFVNDECRDKLINGEILTPSMFEYYEFGGDMNVYATIFPIRKEHSSGQNYKAMLDSFFKKVYSLASDNDVKLKQIMVMSYVNHANMALNALGLKSFSSNDANGKLYIIDRECVGGTRFDARYPEIKDVLI